MDNRIRLGEERSYPREPQKLEEGEIALLAELKNENGITIYRTKLTTLQAPCDLPLIDTNKRYNIIAKGISDSLIASANPIACKISAKTLQALLNISIEDLGVATTTGPSDQDQNDKEQGLGLADVIHQYLCSKYLLFESINENRPQLDAKSKQALFYEFEKESNNSTQVEIDSSLKGESAGEDPFARGLSWLLETSPAAIIGPTYTTKDKKEYLSEMLRLSSFIGRNILLESESLKYNCGPLVAFKEDKDEAIFLKPLADGYEIWDPFSGRSSRRIKTEEIDSLAKDESDNVDPRVISIFPALKSKDTTKNGLVAFAYGQTGKNAYILPVGIICGFAIGFLLSIGKEVGASRWIFGMTALGGLLGATFTVLSPGFRIAVLASLTTTAISLLTPTFNTILTNTALPDRDLALMLQMGAILIAAALLTISLNWVRSSTLVATQQSGNTRLLLASLYRTLQLPTSYFSSLSIGDNILRFGAISGLQQEVKQLIEGGFIKAVLATIYILFMLRISVKLTILSIFFSLALLIPTAYLGYRSRIMERKSQEAEGEASGRNLELISSVSKLRLSGAEVAAAKYWGDAYKKSIAYSFSLDIQSSISKMLQTIVPNLGTLLLFIMVTQLTSEAAASPSLKAPNTGQLLGFFSAFGTFIGSMASLSDLIVGAFDVPILWERAEPLLKTPIEVLAEASDPGELRGQITLDRVSYRYSPELNLTLDQVSFEANPGEFVALVGPSGSGKSTVVRMLLGFGIPEEGTVYFDGKPLNSLKLDRVRRQIGTVMQNSGIFSGSIFEVISGSASIAIEQAWEAVEMVGLADDIRDMPMGMQTVVPEGGGTLSGGQRQRLAIARALVRKPRLLIFDEATSALDNKTQAIVTESLENLKVTRIVIAHRLSTIKNANKIIVIQKGQVEETGTYDTLMQTGGLFYQLMKRQLI